VRELVIDVEDRRCPSYDGALHPIGEDVAQRLDVIPLQFRVLVIRRPKSEERTLFAGSDGGGEHRAILASLINAGPPQGRSSHA
jgi:hypothetical protein